MLDIISYLIMGILCSPSVDIVSISTILQTSCFKDWNPIKPDQPDIFEKYKYLAAQTLLGSEQPEVYIFQEPINHNRYCLTRLDRDRNVIGKTIIYERKCIYFEGEYENKEVRFAKIDLFNEGKHFQGPLINMKAHGEGRLISEEGYEFNGIWELGKPKRGVLKIRTVQDNNKFITYEIDKFPIEQATIRYPDGAIYEGYVDQNLARNGIGNYEIHNHQERYEGEWYNDLKHGKGINKYDNGCQYQGAYLLGERSGYGKYNFKSGNSYQGQWMRGKQNGEGRLLNQFRQVLKQGIWEEGKFIRSELRQE